MSYNNLEKGMRKKQGRTYFILGVFLLVLIGIIDFRIDYQINSSAFYLIPVLFAVRYLGRSCAIAMAVLSIVVSLSRDVIFGKFYKFPFVPYWNGFLNLVFLCFAVFIIELKSSLEKQKKEIRIDHLTGIFNRQFFYEMAGKEIERCRRYNRSFSVAFLDCDNFKYINDNFGHQAGDSFLRVLAKTMHKNVRSTDLVARLGGDEFVVMLIETDHNSSKMFINRFKNLLFNVIEEKKMPVTLSIGVVTCNIPPKSIDDMIRKADELMYSVKKNGKNSVRYEVYPALGS